MSIADIVEPMAYDIAFQLEYFHSESTSPEELGNACSAVCGKFRTLAIVHLVEMGEIEAFYQNLQRSGQTRQRYLQSTQQDAQPLYHQATGRCNAMFDAIAANDLALAQSIANLSTKQFLKNYEYEDDFCVAQLLNILVQDPVPVMDAIPVLEQFDRFLNGEINALYDVLSSLIDQDSDAFAEAFENYLIDYTVKLEKSQEKEIDSVANVMRRHIHVEALALLRLADKFGMPTETEYQYCPRIARQTPQSPFSSIFI